MKLVNATWSSTSGTQATFAHGISTSTYGYYQIIRLEGCASDNYPYFYPINFYNGTTYFSCFADRTYLYLKTTQSNLLGKNVYIAIYFTSNANV